MAEREYQRLTWSRRRSGFAVFASGRASLWLGKDHLLYIETNGYTETYKRFYLRDIQAFSLRRTGTRGISTAILAGIGIILILIGLAARDTTALIALAATAFPICLVPLLINLALGPTCRCEIRTAVQTEDLPIRRVRGAQKIFDRIRPLIAVAQGQLTPEEIPARMQQIAASGAVGVTPAAAPAPAAVSQPADDPDAPPVIIG
jgi:hypothetical protein